MKLFAAELKELELTVDLEATVGAFLVQFEGQDGALARRIVAKGLGPSFIRAAAISEYFCQNCLNRPHLVAILLDHDLAAQARPVGQPAITAENADTAQILCDLRNYRHLNMTRIIWRECGGLCPVGHTLQDLSRLADQLICEAARASFATLSARYGQPQGDAEPDRLMILAMGKLGGMELNMSSDVDLVFLHSQQGQTRGAKPIDHADFFTRHTRQTVDLLARTTADGFVYRVDTRLRPFGRSGRACVNLVAMEQYLSLHGREWERYAYIKQRPVIASQRQTAELNALLKPFVYRKYLDFGVFEGLRKMKDMIAEEIERKELQADIKRGPGGIRELEFMVQTLQLVYGGKYSGLQHSSFFAALEALGSAGYFKPQTVAQFDADYCFLRRLENGLQAARDFQVHKLPDDALDRARLALLMNRRSWDNLEGDIVQVRERVQQKFNELNVAPEHGLKGAASDTAAGRLWRKMTARSDTTGPDEAELSISPALYDTLKTLGERGLRQRLDAMGRARLDQLMPQVIALLAAEDNAQHAQTVVRVIEGIGRRSAYFALLNENPGALQRLIAMCLQSPRLADQLVASPMLLDTLVDPRGTSVQLTRKGLKARFDLQFGELDPLDDEACLLALREFRQSAVFDVAVADFAQQLPVMKVSDRLTEVAELILGEALMMAAQQMQARYGVPRCAGQPDRRAEFAIVGYGKLGGLELAYGSDLDLVFLFDDGGSGETDGRKSVDNSVFFSRLVQRLIHILTVPTAFGALYEVDMRLRPSGRSGLLVSRLTAFELYQREQAWTWEHQALLRSRGVGGDPALIRKFERLRLELLQPARDKAQLQKDVYSMRAKMKDKLDRSTATQFDLKHGQGGLTDLEFLVQYLVLNHCHEVAALAVFSDNVRQIEALQEAGIMSHEQGHTFKHAYLAYRQRLHHLSLADQSSMVEADAFTSERAAVLQALQDRGLKSPD